MTGSDAAPTVPGTSFFRPGSNCLRETTADRAAILIDGADYFRRLESSLRQACHSIIIIGWDFDGRIRLRPDVPESESPQLGRLLRALVEARPQLNIEVLVWSASVVHAPSAVAPALFGADWEEHPRIRVKLDTQHPIYGAHHQKIVCVDGRLAFVGGMDLTVCRWDTPEHQADDPRRIDCDGEPYEPVHDIQMVFDGPAAAVMCKMAAERWQAALGEMPAGIEAACAAKEVPWPEGLEADFRDAAVAIARTEPAYGGREEICEAQALTLDMIAAARHAIYIEAQYLTAPSIGEALARQLKAPDGPDIVIVITKESQGLLERFAMTGNRDRLIRRLARADRHGRLRAVHPVVPTAKGQTQVLVHAKLVIVDDRLIRVGSSNLNNRSIGLDTECDVAIEARKAADRLAIRAIRNRLLAEHLDCSIGEIEAAMEAERGLVAVVDRLNTRPRHLRPFKVGARKGPFRPLPGTSLFDPVRTFKLPWPFG
jgi:phosphatidylserine/phosphatidylglycerophosphate/cardiolipin synthase-like enzyme